MAVMLAMTLAQMPAFASDAFLSVVEDLPLAPGLSEEPGGVLFESPSGRIVEVSATGTVAPAEIESFYAQSLPQLGWQRLAAGIYRRDTEILRIDTVGTNPTAVRFSMAPQQGRP